MAGAVVKQVKSENAAASIVPKPGGRKRATLLTWGAVILGLASVQIVVTYLLMSAPLDTQNNQQHEEHEREGKEHAANGQHGSKHDRLAEDFVEMPVGDFSCSNTTALRNVITHVDFKLAALVSSNQASTLGSQIKWKQNRIHEAVNKIVRSSNLDELHDPNLDTIKRLVLDEINALLRESIIVEVMINDIKVVEQ